jgi:hypothetical protein
MRQGARVLPTAMLLDFALVVLTPVATRVFRWFDV